MKAILFFSSLIFGAIFLVTGSCGSGKAELSNYLVDIDQFHIEQDKLHSGDSLEIVGASGNITNEDKMDAYILYVVKSLRTGETLNILSNSYILITDRSQVLRFVSDSDESGKLSAYALHGEEIPQGKIDDIQPLRFTKVFYDTEWIREDVRKYPALTGELVQYYSEFSTGNTPEVTEERIDSAIDNALHEIREQWLKKPHERREMKMNFLPFFRFLTGLSIFTA